MPHVFLNPDGTQQPFAFVVVQHPTGITYGHQCAGLLTDCRSVQGFLIPVGGTELSANLSSWCVTRWRGNGYDINWTTDLIKSLSDLVSTIPCWHTVDDGGDRREFLQLDRDRIAECVEAWVPVLTPYGPGVLLFENSD
jgi:hypothetical protein